MITPNFRLNVILVLSLASRVTPKVAQYEGAVDGNISQNADTCKCCASTNKSPGETLTVNLEEPYNISRIRIYGRDDEANGELTDLTVYLSNSANRQDGIQVRTLSNVTQEDFTMSNNETYQFVILRTDIAKYVIICEIQVYTKVCLDGYYDDCVKQCGQCKGDATCNKTTGYCPDGCKPGYTGDTCSTLCQDGYYNDCFTHCGHCKEDDPCDKITGHCENGCKPGHKGNTCSTPCEDRYHGDCTQHCGNCNGPDICNKTTGHCEQGCESGYYYPLCTAECQTNTFGFNCISVCGMCKDGAICDIHTGDCPGGCVTGYKGRQCLNEVHQTINTNSDTSVSVPVFVGVLSGVIVVVLAVVLTLIICIKRQRKETNSTESNAKTSSQHPNTSSNYDTLKRETIETDSNYTELNIIQ